MYNPKISQLTLGLYNCYGNLRLAIHKHHKTIIGCFEF